MEPIRNKVAESGIITLDLAPFIPTDDSMAPFDIQPFLFMGLILREKDYRTALQSHHWAPYTGKHIAIFCSADAVIPVWAYMLATTYLQPIAASVHFATVAAAKDLLLTQSITTLPLEDYTDKRVILKGCGDTPIPEAAYVAAAAHLLPAVKSLMYGEPCSTVPVYKKSPKAVAQQ